MKKYMSVLAVAAIAAFITGCDGKSSQSVEVSTTDSMGNLTSEKSSEAVQPDPIVTLTTISTKPRTSSKSVTTAAFSEPERPEPPSLAEKITVASHTVHTTAIDEIVTTETISETHTEITSSVIVTTVTTTRPQPAHHDIIEAYRNAVSTKIDSLLDMEYDNVTVSYTLFDMDSNGIPELIVKYGSCEDDFQHTFYTYDDFGIKVISDGTVGSHTGFAHDTEKKQFVSAYSNQGRGVLEWLVLDGSNINVDKTEEFEYNGDSTFEEQADGYGVEMLPFALYSNSFEETTWIYREVSSRLEFDEIAGRDFSFIENYWS